MPVITPDGTYTAEEWDRLMAAELAYKYIRLSVGKSQILRAYESRDPIHAMGFEDRERTVLADVLKDIGEKYAEQIKKGD